MLKMICYFALNSSRTHIILVQSNRQWHFILTSTFEISFSLYLFIFQLWALSLTLCVSIPYPSPFYLCVSILVKWTHVYTNQHFSTNYTQFWKRIHSCANDTNSSTWKYFTFFHWNYVVTANLYEICKPGKMCYTCMCFSSALTLIWIWFEVKRLCYAVQSTIFNKFYQTKKKKTRFVRWVKHFKVFCGFHLNVSMIQHTILNYHFNKLELYPNLDIHTVYFITNSRIQANRFIFITHSYGNHIKKTKLQTGDSKPWIITKKNLWYGYCLHLYV